jgi:ferrochelatase
MKSWGLVLLNLGTPDSTSTADVRRYLREFLSDPRVIDIHPVGRWLLLNLIILPFRPKQSAEAYEKVFTERGSPLLFHGEDLAAKVGERLGPDVPVTLAMRYGRPSVAAAIEELRRAGVDRIVFFPLFPQYSSAAWGSAVEKVYAVVGGGWNVPTVHVVPPFYEEPAFLRAFADVARPVLDDMRPDRVLLSFHGVPERHCTKSADAAGHCLVRPDCCDRIVAANRNCYRAQCFATARGLARELGLADGSWEVTFQSRLGRTPWIRPYTDVRLTELAAEGVRRIAIMSPAFVADCLETLEELAIRNAADFRAAGGEELRLIPSLNSSDAWADAVAEMSTRALSDTPSPYNPAE